MFRLLLFGHKNLKTLAYNCYFSKDNSPRIITIYPHARGYMWLQTSAPAEKGWWKIQSLNKIM